MRRIRKPIRKKLPPVKLYLDDLESICAILKREAKSIDITTEDYEVEDIKQLKSLEVKKIHYLSINCSEPYISVEFYPSSASIYFPEDSTHSRGILSEIEDILSKRTVFLRGLLPSWASGLVGVLVGVSLGLLISMPKDILMSYGWLFLALLLLCIPLLILLFRFEFRGYSTIVLLERKEEVSFWERNRDQILIAIISAVVGSLLTVAALWIFKSL